MKYNINVDINISTITHPYEYTHTYTITMSTSKKLDQFNLKIHKVGHLECLLPKE
jgi:hypothetical protein